LEVALERPLTPLSEAEIAKLAEEAAVSAAKPPVDNVKSVKH